MQLNTQAPQKIIRAFEGTYTVQEIFHTIQGEGPFAGRPAVFVRLSGCNLQCPLCDTDYTSRRQFMTPDEIGRAVEDKHGDEPCELVILTGGEPFRQPVYNLIRTLLRRGYKVQVETNGTMPPHRSEPEYEKLKGWVINGELTIVCSPKAGKVNAMLYGLIGAYKYVGHADALDPFDGLPLSALNHPASPKLARPHLGYRGPIYLQPVDVQDPVENARHMTAVGEKCMKHGYTLCLQMHKIVNLP